MSPILVLTAAAVEAQSLARALGLEPAGPGRFRGGALAVTAVGPGAARLDAAPTGREPALVVSAGVCGGLAPALAEGALVVPEAVVGPDGVRHATAALPGLAAAGTLLTVREIVATARDKARLWLETGALACDMESAPILAWAAARGLPAAVVRGVADPADRDVPADLAALLEPDGRVRTTRAARALLARPRAAADALALRRGAAAALRAVAAALGEVARR